MSSQSQQNNSQTMSQQKKPLNPDANPFQILPPSRGENSGTSSLSTPMMNPQRVTTSTPNYCPGVVFVPNYQVPLQNAFFVCPSYYYGGIGYVQPLTIGPAYQVSIPVRTSIPQLQPFYQNFEQNRSGPLVSSEESLDDNNYNSNGEFEEEEIHGTVENEVEMGGLKQYEWRIRRNHRFGEVPFPATLEELESSRTTTLMIKHLPNYIKLKDLILLLDDHCFEQNKNSDDRADWSMFDVVYIPMDFRKQAKRGRVSNMGYGFVNFTTPKAAFKFYQQFHGNGWHGEENNKKCMITIAHIQGKEALVENFSAKIFRCNMQDFQPVVFLDPRNGFNRESEGTQLGRVVEGSSSRALPSHVSPTANNESTPNICSHHPSTSHEEDVNLLSGRIASMMSLPEVQDSNSSPSLEENIST